MHVDDRERDGCGDAAEDGRAAVARPHRRAVSAFLLKSSQSSRAPSCLNIFAIFSYLLSMANVIGVFPISVRR